MIVRGTKPDLAYTLSNLFQYAKENGEIHLQTVKGVLQYIQGTKTTNFE